MFNGHQKCLNHSYSPIILPGVLLNQFKSEFLCKQHEAVHRALKLYMLEKNLSGMLA